MWACLPSIATCVACWWLQVREKELELIRKTATVKTLNLCLVFAVPPVIALVIFATYAYSVGPINSSMAFVVLSLFNTLRFPLVVLPKALRGASGKLGNHERTQMDFHVLRLHVDASSAHVSRDTPTRQGHMQSLKAFTSI